MCLYYFIEIVYTDRVYPNPYIPFYHSRGSAIVAIFILAKDPSSYTLWMISSYVISKMAGVWCIQI